MDILPLLCIVSVAFTGFTKGAGVLPDGPLNATVGEAVMFTTIVTPPEHPFISVNWKFNDRDIINSNVGNITEPEYEGRITLFVSTASLELRSLALNDSGLYRVTIIPRGGRQMEGNTRLEVYVPVSNVTLNASSRDLVEFSSSVRLSCSSSGSSPSFLWLNGSSEVTAGDRVQVTDGGSTLTITNVTRYDQGPFTCRVFNPVSAGTSDPVTFSISYGPENTNVTISPPQNYIEEGSNISLSCSAVSRPPAQFQWFLNGVQSGAGPDLSLIQIQTSQSGNYSCQAFNEKTGRYETSQPSVVSVLARVANVVVTPNTTELLEFNSTVSLSCSSFGSSLSFFWLNGSSEVTPSDRVQLSDGGSTLTIVNVTRYDQGALRCQVFNPVSNGISDPVNLSISYGPDNINLTLSSKQEYFEEGSSIGLSCSAGSRPSALFYWFLNGDMLPDTGPELSLMNIQTSHSGNYSCQAFNNKTLRYQTSQPTVVSVLARISAASVKSSTNLPVDGNSVNLTCDAAGSIFTRKWMKDGSDLTLTDTIILHDNNRVLSFSSLNKKDSGEYSCKISNPISTEEARYNMVVNYGPENVQITGPGEIEERNTLTLTCSAESTPSATYIWILNGTKIHTSSVFTKNITEFSDSGSYTCQAMNYITGKTSSVVHGLTVKGKSGGLSGGAIAGIIIAILVIVAAAAGGGYYVYRKKKGTKTSSNGNAATTIGDEGQYNRAYSGSQELNYADIRFFQNKQGGTVQLGLQNNSSEYAQVQLNSNPPAASSPPTYDVHMQRMKRPAPQPDANGAQIYAQIRKN